MTHTKTNAIWNRTQIYSYSSNKETIFFMTKTKTTVKAHNTDEHIASIKYECNSTS